MAQNSKLVFSTTAVHKITGKAIKVELFLVEEDNTPPFFVSDHPELAQEALASEVLCPYNPFNPDQRQASILLAMVAVHGFKSFEE